MAGTTGPAHKVKATIRITIPKSKRHRVLKRGRYISPATQSITIAVTPSSGPVVNYNADLTPATNQNCTVGIVSPLICTVTLSLSPGSYTATFATYDGLLSGGNAPDHAPTGNVLSENQNVPIDVAAGQANQIDVVLGGVPASLLLVPLASSLHGDAASGYSLPTCFISSRLEVLGLDADDNVIVGPGAPVPTLTSGDPAHLAILATPSPSSPNTYTLSRAANPVVSSIVQLTAAVTPAAGSGAATVSQNINVTFGNTICSVYFTDSTRGRVDEITSTSGTFPASPTVKTVASMSNPTSVTLDASGNLFATSAFDDTVEEFLAVGGVISGSPTVNTLGSGFTQPLGIAVDASGNAFVTDSPNGVNGTVKEIVAVGGSIPASPTIKALGNGFVFGVPCGIALDASGNLYIGDFADIYEILAAGGYKTVKTLTNTFGVTICGIAVDASGDVFASDDGTNTVKELIAVDGSIPASPTIRTLGSFNGPLGVAVDPSGNVYVAEANSDVKEMLAVGGSIPASPTINVLATGINPYGLALR